MQIPWYVTALGTALVWGIHYPLVDFALKRLSLFGVLLLTMLPALLIAPLFYRQLATDIDTLKTLPVLEQWIIGLLGFSSLTGVVLLYMSIANKNATLASLIEITYPVFVVLFSYVLFKQMHINISAAVGGALIIAGAGLIIYNNP